jgi:hypothetical protein
MDKPKNKVEVESLREQIGELMKSKETVMDKHMETK